MVKRGREGGGNGPQTIKIKHDPGKGGEGGEEGTSDDEVEGQRVKKMWQSRIKVLALDQSNWVPRKCANPMKLRFEDEDKNLSKERESDRKVPFGVHQKGS